MAAGARSRRAVDGRTVRSLPTAHPDRRGAPAVPRGFARPRRGRSDRTSCASRCAICSSAASPPSMPIKRNKLDAPASRCLLSCRCALLLAAVQTRRTAARSEPQPPAQQPAAGTAGDPRRQEEAEPADAEFPTLQIATLDGAQYDLAAHRGKWVVVNFWATWCKPCVKEMPDLSALDAMREHIEVLGLAYDDSEPQGHPRISGEASGGLSDRDRRHLRSAQVLRHAAWPADHLSDRARRQDREEIHGPDHRQRHRGRDRGGRRTQAPAEEWPR